jgi:hypothetical protein
VSASQHQAAELARAGLEVHHAFVHESRAKQRPRTR